MSSSARTAAAVRADTVESVAAGFRGRLAIHPDQVAPIHDALRPDERQVEWARRVVAVAAGSGAPALDGAMVDRPVMLRARALLARAGMDQGL